MEEKLNSVIKGLSSLQLGVSEEELYGEVKRKRNRRRVRKKKVQGNGTLYENFILATCGPPADRGSASGLNNQFPSKTEPVTYNKTRPSGHLGLNSPFTDKAAPVTENRQGTKGSPSSPSGFNSYFTGKIASVTDDCRGTVIRKKGPGVNISFNAPECSKAPIKYVTPVSLIPSINRERLRNESSKGVEKMQVPTVGSSDRRKYVEAINLKSKMDTKANNSPKNDPGQPLVGLKLPEKKRREKKRQPAREKPKPSGFEEYLTAEEAERGLKNGTLVKGVLRINPKFYTEAYVSHEDKNVQDFFIGSVAERNRALEGDVVVLEVKPENEWRENQQKAKVVHILEKVHPRQAVGYLKPLKDNVKRVASFEPRDKRIPHMNIDETSLPENYFKLHGKFQNVLFLGQMVGWEVPKYAVGMILENIGKSTDLKAETKSILLENQIDFAPFPSDVQKYLPQSKTIDASEFKYREDLRKDCIFTIDPSTAKDLDDAVSCKELVNGNFEIGVHIADVAFYLAENTPLDELVSKKATSTYLVDAVYHMLPPEMCLHCSLLPGRDCLAFSVILEVTPDAEIISKRFTRSVINSCAKLAYEHAQKIIENPDEEIKPPSFPYVYGNFSIDQIRSTVLNMQALAKKMRAKRFENGALRIDQVKLGFQLDPSGNPTGFYTQELKDANRMIEEYMLLANITVAEKIYQCFPKLALLRCHDEPHMRLLKDVKNTLEIIGMHLNIDSSQDLYESLKKYHSDDYYGVSRYIALNHLLAKPMVRARYFCANNEERQTFHHYALSIPIYTHFTSPIRRYADVMVHRLLAAALGYTGEPNWSADRVREIANNCNAQKQNAKKAGEGSIDLYLAHYVEKNQPFVTDAVVVNVQDKSFDAITIHTGTTVRVHANSFEEKVSFCAETYGGEVKSLWKMVVKFPQTATQPEAVQVIDLFQIVQVSLKRKCKTNKLEANLERPNVIKIPLSL